MQPVSHVIISTGVSALFAVWAKAWEPVLACFLSGIFIDLDHHLDFYIEEKKIPFSYKKLVAFLDGKHRRCMYFFLHSYEFLAVIWICVFIFNLNMIWWGVAIGFTTHVLCDEFANPVKPRAYFLLYRMKKHFDRTKLLKKSALAKIFGDDYEQKS